MIANVMAVPKARGYFESASKNSLQYAILALASTPCFNMERPSVSLFFSKEMALAPSEGRCSPQLWLATYEGDNSVNESHSRLSRVALLEEQLQGKLYLARIAWPS